MKKSSILELIVVVFLILLSLGFTVGQHLEKNTYMITVADKQVKRHDDNDKYLIYATINYEVKVFENTDSLIEGKFNSADMCAELQVEKTYNVKTYGWRIPIISSYEKYNRCTKSRLIKLIIYIIYNII